MAKAEKETKTKAEIYREERKKRIAKQQKKQQKITPASIKRKRIVKRVLKTLVAVILILAVASGIVFATGVPNKFLTAVTVGDHNVTVADYNYYYYTMAQDFISQYGQMASFMGFDPNKDYHSQSAQSVGGSGTFGDLFHDQAINSLKMTLVLNDLAKEEGITMTDEDNEVVKTYMDGLKNVLKKNNTTIRQMFGKGATEKSVLKAIEMNVLAQRYGTYKRGTFTYDDADIQKRYDENRDDYDVVDYMSFDFPTTAEDDADDAAKAEAKENAKKLADAMLAKVTDKASFAKLAKENALETNKEKYEDEDGALTSECKKASVPENLRTWIFDNSRKAGDKTVIENGSAYTVVMMINPRYKEEYNAINVRHILIEPETTGDAAATDAQKAAAKKKAEDLLAAFNSGDKTEESFATLAKENSSDAGSAVKGGLYENVLKGDMVDTFNDWCFDPARKIGDVGIVETTYGYHVMYFVGLGDIKWKLDAEEDLIDEAYQSYYDAKAEAYKTEEKSFGMRFAEK